MHVGRPDDCYGLFQTTAKVRYCRLWIKNRTPLDRSGQTWCFVQSDLLRLKTRPQHARRVLLWGADNTLNGVSAAVGGFAIRRENWILRPVDKKIEPRLTGPVNRGVLFKVNCFV
jgi:hypothetical protein